MSKGKEIIFLISLGINLILGYLLYSRPQKVNSDSEQFIMRIDSLESELTILQKDKVKIEEKIDTVFVELKSTNKEYVKACDSIIANSPTDDYRFFIDYLERNRARLNSINNF